MALGISALCPAMAQAQEFKTTPAKEVAANPQRFWARGVVFRDTLAEAINGKGAKRIAGRRAYPFLTKVVGTCYADESILPALRELPPDNEYIFTATVYSDRVGLIRRQTKYFILVSGVTAPASNIGALVDELEAASVTNIFSPPLVELRELLVRVQAAMTADMETGGYSRSEFFDPKSEHFPKLEQIVRRTVGEMENEAKAPAREHYVMMIRSLIALKEGVFSHPDPAETSETVPAEDEQAGDPAEAVEAPAPEAAIPDTPPALRLTVQPGRQAEQPTDAATTPMPPAGEDAPPEPAP